MFFQYPPEGIRVRWWRTGARRSSVQGALCSYIYKDPVKTPVTITARWFLWKNNLETNVNLTSLFWFSLYSNGITQLTALKSPPVFIVQLCQYVTARHCILKQLLLPLLHITTTSPPTSCEGVSVTSLSCSLLQSSWSILANFWSIFLLVYELKTAVYFFNSSRRFPPFQTSSCQFMLRCIHHIKFLET